MANSQYLIALGSNQRHKLYGGPSDILRHTVLELDQFQLKVLGSSRIIKSRPIGPSRREYANAAAVIESPHTPSELLKKLKDMEAAFGERTGQRWSARVLDLDIILWSDGVYACDHPSLAIPHPSMRQRDFVLGPAAEIAADWRDPLTGLTIRHLLSREKRAKPLDRNAKPH